LVFEWGAPTMSFILRSVHHIEEEDDLVARSGTGSDVEGRSFTPHGEHHDANGEVMTAANRPPSRKQAVTNKPNPSKKPILDTFLNGSPTWDTFLDCVFSFNMALGDVKPKASHPVIGHANEGGESLDGSSATGGAIALDYGFTAVGDEPTGTLRRTSLTRNEAFGQHSAGGINVYHSGFHRFSSLTWSDVTLAENHGDTGGAVLAGIRLSSTRVNVARNRGNLRGGGLSLSENSNVTGSFWQCRNNFAMLDGGCAALDATSLVSLSRSEIVNNSATRNSGTTFSGGTVVISESKVLSVFRYAIRALFLMLSSSELNCAEGTPISIIDGFGCLPNPPDVSSATASAEAEAMRDASPSWHASASTLRHMDGIQEDDREGWTYAVDALLLLVALFAVYQLWSVVSNRRGGEPPSRKNVAPMANVARR